MLLLARRRIFLLQSAHETPLHCRRRKARRWYAVFVEGIPGVNTLGKTLAEVRRNLKDALILVSDGVGECR
jgi:hypothetical protein